VVCDVSVPDYVAVLCRYRKLKEKLGMTDVRKQMNRVAFGVRSCSGLAFCLTCSASLR